VTPSRAPDPGAGRGEPRRWTAQEIIARGISQPWSDYERQAGSIVDDLRAAGFEVVEASAVPNPKLREAAQEALVVLAALVLADAQAEREGGLRVHAPEVLEQMSRAHDLLFAALSGTGGRPVLPDPERVLDAAQRLCDRWDDWCSEKISGDALNRDFEALREALAAVSVPKCSTCTAATARTSESGTVDASGPAEFTFEIRGKRYKVPPCGGSGLFNRGNAFDQACPGCPDCTVSGGRG
jgi:hypothetical protein